MLLAAADLLSPYTRNPILEDDSSVLELVQHLLLHLFCCSFLEPLLTCSSVPYNLDPLAVSYLVICLAKGDFANWVVSHRTTVTFGVGRISDVPQTTSCSKQDQLQDWGYWEPGAAQYQNVSKNRDASSLCVCLWWDWHPTQGKSSLVALPILHIMSLASTPYSEQLQEIWLHVLMVL